MLATVLFYLLILSGIVLVAVLVLGVGTFGKGGRENQLKSNKMMRARLASQAVFLVILLAYLYARSL